MEVWKNIEGYEDYQVSNLGRVKSLKRNKEIILNAGLRQNNYLLVILHKNNKRKTFNVHQLVAIAFLNHKPSGYKLVINHINHNKLDNRVENLEIVTARVNSNLKHIKSSSIYTGVSWQKKSNKWISQIRIDGKLKYLGLFKCEIKASNAYQNALKELL
jgi:hypothetical protein